MQCSPCDRKEYANMFVSLPQKILNIALEESDKPLKDRVLTILPIKDKYAQYIFLHATDSAGRSILNTLKTEYWEKEFAWRKKPTPLAQLDTALTWKRVYP